MLTDRIPPDDHHLVDAGEYIVHKGKHQIYPAHWKSSVHGRIVYSAGTLDVHIKNTYRTRIT